MCAFSSIINQSGGGGVHTEGRGIDSEGDEYEDDQEILDDSETSDDSDPELASPCFIRQTQLSIYISTFLSLTFCSLTVLQ